MSSTPKEKKRKQQDTSGRPSLQDSKKPKKQIRRSQPAESSHSGKTSPAKHIKPEMPDVLIEDPSSSSSATLGPDSTPSTTTEPEHSPSSSESDRIFSPRTESDGTSYSSSEHASTFSPPSGSDGTSPSSSEHASTFFPPSGSDGTSPSSSEHASTFSPPSGSDGTSSSPSESAHSNGTSSSSSESEHTPEPVEQIVLAAEEAAIIHGPIKTAAIRGTLKEYVLQQSRDREPQPFPIPHQQLSTPHNKNNHRGLLDSEVWRVSPTFNRLAVSSFGRFVLDKFFLILQDQFSRRHRHQPSIRFVMNEEEREVHNFPLVAQNLYHIEADEQVLLAFGHRQPTPESQYIIHLDGDFWNCSLDNLRWATHAEFYAHHPFDKRILFSRVASMNFNPRLPWQSDIHNTMYLITRTGDVTSYSKHQGEKIPQGHDAISPVDGLLTKRLEVVNQSLDNQITRTLSVAAMVLDTFRGYNPNAPFIIFEDGDRRNAVLDNLRAATREEYSQHLTETLPTRFAPREVFTSIGNISQTRGDFDLSRYWISNITGKVYSEFYNKLLSYDNQIPYAVIPLSPPNSTRQIQFAIHHLVHNAHVEPNVPGFEIDHIYANTLDVSAANLRMVHPNANIKLAYALDRGKDLRDVTREQLLTGNFNIDDMRDALPEQVPRRTRVPFPAWSDEDIATEIEKGTWSPIVINSEHSGYEVSTRGMVKRINSHRIIHSAISTGGYVYVSLSIEGQTFRRALHTIIARAFIHNDDPNNKKVVDHINRNRTDFSIDNLEWVTFAENSVRAIGVGVDVYDEENDLVTSFCSIRQCAENFVFDGRRYSEAHLQDVSRRRGVLHGGYYLVRR